MLENGTKTATSSLDATAVSQCSRATAIFQLYRSIWSGTKSSATKGERGSRNEQTGSKRYNTDKSRHYPQLHVARVYSRRQRALAEGKPVVRSTWVGCRKRSVRRVSRKLKRVVSTLKDGVSLGDACRIPGSARTRISTQRNGCDSCQCNDLKRRCHTLSLCFSVAPVLDFKSRLYRTSRPTKQVFAICYNTVMNRQAVTNRAVTVKNYREKGETSWKTCRYNLCSTNENTATIKFVPPPPDSADEDRRPEKVRKRKETRERKNRRLVNGKILKFQRGQSNQYIYRVFQLYPVKRCQHILRINAQLRSCRKNIAINVSTKFYLLNFRPI